MEQTNKVMVIDDDETFLLPLRLSLKRREIECVTFTNPEEAIEYLKTNKVDILLIDYHMEPNINGGEVVKRIREFNEDVIIYLQTAFAEELPAEEMMDKYDIQGYIDKGKGDKENMQLIKSALKHAKTLEMIKEKDKEIAMLSYKKAIVGDLISHLVNESKNQLFQIAAMNESIKKDTDDYTEENVVIENATDKIYELYEALNFEEQKTMNIEKVILTLKELLKAKMLISNIKLQINCDDNTIIINNNADKLIYLILKIIDLFEKDNSKEIAISIERTNEDIKFTIKNEKDSLNINVEELKMFVDSNILKISTNNNSVILFM